MKENMMQNAVIQISLAIYKYISQNYKKLGTEDILLGDRRFQNQ